LRNTVEAFQFARKEFHEALDDLAKMKAERDEALLKMGRIRNEIDCRIEHGAESNGHLEAIRTMIDKENTND
jgi:hypothetical protein